MESCTMAGSQKAIAEGTFEIPEHRFPVLITPNGPVSSPKKLQRNTGRASLYN
jgi:hypothetical protein